MLEIYINQHDESTRVAHCPEDRNSLPCTKSYRPHERFVRTAGSIRVCGVRFNSRRVHHQNETACPQGWAVLFCGSNLWELNPRPRGASGGFEPHAAARERLRACKREGWGGCPIPAGSTSKIHRPPSDGFCFLRSIQLLDRNDSQAVIQWHLLCKSIY